MNKTIDILRCFANTDDHRLNDIMEFHGLPAATDGRVLAWAMNPAPEFAMRPMISGPESLWFDNLESPIRIPAGIVLFDDPSRQCETCCGVGRVSIHKCDVCNGEGCLESDLRCDVYDCPCCYGNKKITAPGSERLCAECVGSGTDYDGMHFVEIEHRVFNHEFIRRVRAINPKSCLLIAIHENGRCLTWEIDGFRGIIMPVTPWDGMTAHRLEDLMGGEAPCLVAARNERAQEESTHA